MSLSATMKAGVPDFDVIAEVEPGKPWRSVLFTADRLYAFATAGEFREAGVKVRVDLIVRKPRGGPFGGKRRG